MIEASLLYFMDLSMLVESHQRRVGSQNTYIQVHRNFKVDLGTQRSLSVYLSGPPVGLLKLGIIKE